MLLTGSNFKFHFGIKIPPRQEVSRSSALWRSILGYHLLSPSPPSSTLLGIRSNFIGPFGDAGKQSQTNAVRFARSFTTFKHNIFLGDQIRQRNIRILKLQACVSCVWIPGSVTVNVSIIISSDHRCLYRILVGIIETPGLENL